MYPFEVCVTPIAFEQTSTVVSVAMFASPERSPPASPATPAVSLSDPEVPADGSDYCAGEVNPWPE
jgi:hypothetical protein